MSIDEEEIFKVSVNYAYILVIFFQENDTSTTSFFFRGAAEILSEIFVLQPGGKELSSFRFFLRVRSTMDGKIYGFFFRPDFFHPLG